MSKGKYAKNTGSGGTKSLALLLALTLLVGGAVGGTVAWLTASTQKVTNTFTTSNIKIELTETGATAGTGKTDQTKNYQMVPGWTLDKNPKVTVKEGSEDCYLFVKVTTTGKAKVGNTDYGITDYLDYKLLLDEASSGWIQGNGTGEDKNGVPVGVYYKIVESPTTKDEVFTLLKAGSGSYTDRNNTTRSYTWGDNQVYVKPTVTNEMMAALGEEGAVLPSITFTAYASQLWKTNKPTDESKYSEAQFTPAEAWNNVAPASGT